MPILETQSNRVSQLLVEWRDGDAAALDELMPLIHAELRRLARRYLRQERRDHSFDPTDLVHEVYLRLVGRDHPRWRDRAHFYAVAAQLMRRILVDHARAVQSAKRGSGMPRIPIDEAMDAVVGRAADVVALDDALKILTDMDPRKSRIIELRYFGGLTVEETAEVLGVSIRTVHKNARLARAWLYSQLSAEPLSAEPPIDDPRSGAP